MEKIYKNRSIISITLSVFLSVLFVAIAVNAATTIGTNVDTTGTINASSTMIASSTLQVTGAVTTYGAVTLGDAAGDLIVLTGNASTSQALTVAGNFYVGGYATATAASGNIVTKGNLGVGTTTNATEISGSGSATTTMYLTSTSATAGACLQLEAPDGTIFRTYATTAGPLYVETGSCK